MTCEKLAKAFAENLGAPIHPYVVRRVRAYNVLAVGGNSLDIFNWKHRRIWVAEKMELLP